MDRLWNRTDRSGICWIWTGCKDNSGYGLISVGGRMMRTHRLAWELTHGPIPFGLFVCHHCDTRACINPEHLFLGTHKDNMQDKVRKGRRNGGGPAYGERNGSAKLTTMQVIEIRQLYNSSDISERELAQRFGIGKSQAHRIVSGVNWK
jgi:hypothetical protein